MSEQTNESAKGSITWDFFYESGGNIVRYGRIGADYYKQLMPSGIEYPSMHPPKRITEFLYNLAKRNPANNYYTQYKGGFA